MRMHVYTYTHNCSRVGDAGLEMLGANLPSELAHVQLNLAGCEQLGDAGPAATIPGESSASNAGARRWQIQATPRQ